jgi:hypothetical protein
MRNCFIALAATYAGISLAQYGFGFEQNVTGFYLSPHFHSQQPPAGCG